MRGAIVSLRSADRAARRTDARSIGSSWVQFGDEALVLSDDAEWTSVKEEARLRSARLEPLSAPVREENLYLVVQKGRLFQKENPDVPVLVDKGRYLVVELDPERAERVDATEGVCFTIEPLPRDQVVFDLRPAAAAARREPLVWVQELVEGLDRSRLRATLEHLVSFGTRYSTSSQYEVASDWARDQMTGLGYATSLQAITLPGASSRNVIADKPGTGNGAKDLILAAAHLDSINMSGASAPAPGADDNGSGSAGVLELARALATHSGVHDLRFVLFGGEEQGLYGSKQYLASLDAEERARIRAVVNMDMIASLNTADITVLVEGGPVSQAMMNDLVAAAGNYTDLAVQTSLRYYNSDHVPFIEAGIPAVLTIEGADGANDNVHSADDVLDHIDYDLALEILRMNVAFMVGALGKEESP